MNYNIDETINEGGMLVRDAIIALKNGKTAFCYKEWQIDEIKEKLYKKHKIKVNVEKKDGWYWVLSPQKWLFVFFCIKLIEHRKKVFTSLETCGNI